MSALPPLDPHPSVFRPGSFLCGDKIGCHVGYAQQPDRVICGNLLEDVGDWWKALSEARDMPPGLLGAMETFYEAVLGWSEWLDRSAQRSAEGAHINEGDQRS